MAKITPESIAGLKALFQDNEKALGSNFSQLIDFFNNNKVTDNGDGTFSVGNTVINVNDIVQEPEIRSMILSQLKASTDLVIKEQLDTKADDSKVVHSTDMRKPASDVAGIEEVNAKQDKIGYTPANDSQVAHNTGNEEIGGQKTFDMAPIDKTTGNPYITKSDMPKVTTGLVVKGSVNNASQLPKDGNQEGYCYFVGTDLYVWVNGAWKNLGNVSPDLSNYTTVTDLNNGLSTKVTDNHDGTITANNLTYDLSKSGLTPISASYSGSYNDLPLGTVFATSKMTGGPDTIHAFTTTTFYFNDWNPGRKAQIAITDSANLMYLRVYGGASWTSWVLLSDDSKVVHKTGDEEISGSKTFDTAPIDKATGNPYITMSDVSPLIQGVVHDGADLNNELQSGTYFSATKVTNGPGFYIAGVRDVMIIWTVTKVISSGSTAYTQMAYNQIGNMAVRNFVSGSGWGKWTIIADDSKVAHLSGANNFDTVPTVNNKSMATKTDVTTAVNTAISNMVDSTPPSLAIADDGTYTITAPATTSTPIVKYFLHYNVDGQSDATKLDVGTKLTGNLKELITKPGTTTTYDVQATAMHANTESGASNSVQFTYVPIDESIYGASWDRKSSSTLTRTDAAVGLKAGINGAQNDFDNVGPWKDMHRVTDSMNNVFVRVPKFYIRKTQTGNSDNGTATWQVSLVSHGDDWYLPKGFWDFTNSKELDYIDIGAYDATGSSSKLTSVAGKAPLVSLSIVDFRSAAKANGTGYQIWDIHAWDMLQVLFIIEFATLNSQSIMEGVDNGSSAVKSGATDRHKGSSGTTGSGSNAMSYRGIENLYGNIWQLCDGVNFRNNQPWVCEDATKYQSDLFATPYVKTSYAAVSSGSNNYIKALGFDSVHPYAQFSTDNSGSDSTYYADYDYTGSGNIILETGGGWGAGAAAGLFGSLRGNSSPDADAFAGCRLLKKALS